MCYVRHHDIPLTSVEWQKHFALLQEMPLLSLASFYQTSAVKSPCPHHNPMWVRAEDISLHHVAVSLSKMNQDLAKALWFHTNKRGIGKAKLHAYITLSATIGHVDVLTKKITCQNTNPPTIIFERVGYVSSNFVDTFPRKTHACNFTPKYFVNALNLINLSLSL